MRHVARAAHRRGIPLVVSTLIPRADAHLRSSAERQRRIVNRELHRARWVNLLVDFDRAVRAPDGGWNPTYDSGDQVHLNPAGYRVLARTVPIALLDRTITR
ncbi:hypothetical protein [Nocardioides rubriscoriae]|uniref:hypothetical protein n=1 Tax=Nocardioides rubriscoriae TaxID=642762 RepID=UPI0011E0476C|nr:hypothetical protein [Nocardioides rubriscoriae]